MARLGLAGGQNWRSWNHHATLRCVLGITGCVSSCDGLHSLLVNPRLENRVRWCLWPCSRVRCVRCVVLSGYGFAYLPAPLHLLQHVLRPWVTLSLVAWHSSSA